MHWAWDETFDISRDTGTLVIYEDFSVPFPFTGSIGKITIDLGASTAAAEAIREMMKKLAMKRDR